MDLLPAHNQPVSHPYRGGWEKRKKIFPNSGKRGIMINNKMPAHEVLGIKNFFPPLDLLHLVQHMNTQTLNLEQTLTTLGGRVTCQRCQAKSKRTKLQCAAPALKGKRVCKTHGGRSGGPRTEAGRQRCAEAKTIHGRETREARSERSLASARLAVLEAVGHALGFMNGTRTRGRKPERMTEAYPELQALPKVYVKGGKTG